MSKQKYPYNILNALSAPLRSNRFIVTILDNTGKSVVSSELESIDMPESSISTIALQVDNKSQTLIPYAANYSTNSVSLTFRELEKGGMYKFFNNWINRVIPRQQDMRIYNIPYYNTIVEKSNMTVDFLAINNEVLNTIKFNNIYPSNIKLSNLDMNTRDDYVKSTINIVFEEFTYI